MKCPQFILEIINRYEYQEVDHFEWKLFLKSLYRMFRGARPIFAIRMFSQEVFRKNHLSDLHIWDTTSYMARDCLKRMRAFHHGSWVCRVLRNGIRRFFILP